MLSSMARMVQRVMNWVASNQSVRNVMWNLLGGGLSGVLIVVTTPLYVARLGLEGYGILGLWLMMQILMGLLDAGIGATLVREFASNRAEGPQGTTLSGKRDLLRTLESVYWAVALALCIVLLVSAGSIAEHWLKSQTLSKAFIGRVLRLMAVTLALQFPNALYLNGMAGLQKHGRMNAMQILGNVLRYGSGLGVLLWKADLLWFFAIQALVATIQTLSTRWMLWRMISDGTARSAVFRGEIFRRLWRYSLGMGATAISSVLLANADRIVLSKMLPTSELGKYAVAYTATGLLQMGIQPFYRAFFPRYAELVSMEDSAQLRSEYFRSCRLLTAVLIPLGIGGGVFAPQLFKAWLGVSDPTIISVFRWLLFGITCTGLMWLPAAFQQAQGKTSLHAGMIAGALLLGFPVMIWAIRMYGAAGATAVWVIHGVSGITLELWLMHRWTLVGELRSWYSSVIAPPLLITTILVGVSRGLMPQEIGRWSGFAWAGGSILLIIMAVASYLFAQGYNNIESAINVEKSK